MAFTLILFLGTFLVLLLAPLPWRWREARWAGWVTSAMARLALRVLGFRLTVEDPVRLSEHRGFVFANHTSLIDVIALEAHFPMRYLAKNEVAKYPVFGTLARANETVFVMREDKASRAEARLSLGKIGPFPPIVLFPEGTTNPGDRLLPFRHGAFATAAATQLPILLCAITYDRPDITTWREESLAASFWRVVCHRDTLHVTLRPLPTAVLVDAGDAITAAENAFNRLAAVLAPYGMARPSDTNSTDVPKAAQ